jgi:hypothetical protein
LWRCYNYPMLMKNIKHYKSIVVSLALVAGLLISGSALAAGAPTVSTVAISGTSAVSSTSATLKGTVWPNGADTLAWFELSPNSNMSNLFPGGGPIGSTTVLGTVTNQTISFTQTGLTPNTTYYYRIKASNQYGLASPQGTTYSFTTTSGSGSGTGSTGTGNCTVNFFNINGQTSATISTGSTALLSWDTTNCTNVTLSGGGMSNSPQNVDGQLTVNPSGAGTYTFTLTANGNGPTVTVTRVLTVGSGGSGTGTTGGGSCIINNFKINGSNGPFSTSYFSGMQMPLTWQTTGCTDVSISGGGMSNSTYAADGQIIIAPSAPGNYTFTLTAHGGTNPTAVRVLTLTGGGGSGTGTGTSTGGGNCAITSFTPYSTQVNAGGSTTLGWSTSNCTSASISGIGSVSLGGSTSTGAIYGTTTFMLTASGPGGTVTSSRTITVNQNQHCDITNFNASSLNINANDSVTLSWNSQNCTSISLSGGSLSGTYGANGSLTVSPNSTTSYTITGYGSGGWNDTASVTVTVQQNQQPQNNCQISYFNAAQQTVSYGGTTTLNWSTSNCTNAYVSGPGVWASGTNSSTTTAAIYTSGTYTITAYGTGGQQSQSVTVTATGQQQQNNQGCMITNFYASPASVLRGGSTTLFWNTIGNCANATVTNMSGHVSNVSANGSTTSGTMNILGTRTFTLRVYDIYGAVSQQTVSVQVYNNGTAQTIYACSDGYDNDGDGLIDGNDPGCSSSVDGSEFNTTGGTGTGTTGGSVNGITISTNTADDYNSYSNRSNLGGLALFSGISLPGTLVGWLILIIIIALLVLLLRNIIGYAPVRGQNHGHRPTGTDGHH